MPSYAQRHPGRFSILCLVCVSLLCANAAPAAEQKEKKKKKDASAASSVSTAPRLPDEQAIEIAISEMLAAWQIGDTDRLHQYYADDVSVVSGAWEPPVTGWTNFLASYQKLRARVQEVRKDRENTLVRVYGSFAWACFQWDFSATVDGQAMMAHGQTTLVFEKRSDRWLIVHDHTSIVQTMQSPLPAGTPASAPPQAPK
jgi:uncharacterized protein (TIGR02246 family)